MLCSCRSLTQAKVNQPKVWEDSVRDKTGGDTLDVRLRQNNHRRKEDLIPPFDDFDH